MVSRRRLRAASALALTSVAVAGFGAAPPSRAASAPTRPYAGTTIRVVLDNHPWTVAIKPLFAQFTQETGIIVKPESYGEDQLTQKLTVEFASGASNIDVFMQRPLQEARFFTKNNYYTDLTPYVKKAPSSYNYGDFEKAALSTETVNGQLTGIPIVVEHEVLYYRKDLLQAAHLGVPKTLAQLQLDAAKLTNKGKNIYGFVARGQQSPSVTQFSSYLYENGGDFYDQKSYKATLSTPGAIAAFQLYGNLLRNDGPPGTLNMSWPQAVAVFGRGDAALYTDADSIYSNLLDPAKSQVAGKTGVAPFPAGPKGFEPYSVTSWGLSIPSSAPHKGAAWQFIQWATSKERTLQAQGNGAVPAARASVYATAAGVAKFPKDWLAAVRASAGGRNYDRPLLRQVGKARLIIGGVIAAAIQGQDVKLAAQSANSQLQQLLDTEHGG